jgi:hypothetical protein
MVERYHSFGMADQAHGKHHHHKKFYLLIFKNHVSFEYLSHDLDTRIVETHSNMATFEKDYCDKWGKIVSTSDKLELTDAYWEVPFVGGRRKVETKMTPKKVSVAERKALRNAANAALFPDLN